VDAATGKGLPTGGSMRLRSRVIPAAVVVLVVAGWAGVTWPSEPGGPSEAVRLNPDNPPENVQARRPHDRIGNEVHLSWDTVPGAAHYRLEQDGELSDLTTETSVTVAVAGGRTYTYRVQAVGSDRQTHVSEWSEPVTLEVPSSRVYAADLLATDFDDPSALEGWHVDRMGVERGRLAAVADNVSGWAQSEHFDFVDQSTLTIEFAPLEAMGDDQWIALELKPGHGLKAERFYAHLARLNFTEKRWAVRVVDGERPVIDRHFAADVTVPAWAQIRREGDTLVFRASEDGTSWRRLATVPFDTEPRGVHVLISGVNWEQDSRPWNRRRIRFDNLNLPPPALALGADA
jgi:hypothetical protein